MSGTRRSPVVTRRRAAVAPSRQVGLGSADPFRRTAIRSLDGTPGRRGFQPQDIEQSISSRFEQQVDAYPDRIAVKSADRSLTYQALNRAANRVAWTILDRRGDAEEPIALLVEPGPSAIVMLLGVLKAGKFYVPLDASHPISRLRDIMQNAQPAMLLTSAAHHRLATAIAGPSCQVVDADTLDADQADGNPNLDLSADRLGYLFYTSGSTGRPKGVTQRQRSILHQIMTYTNGLQIRADDRVTMLHSHAFSASRLDIFGALLNGAGLFPFSVADAGIPHLVRWLRAEGLTVSHWIPSLFRSVAHAIGDGRQLPALRAIVLGSEPVLPCDVALFQRHFGPGCRLVNRFGSTETGNIVWAFFTQGSAVPVGAVAVGDAIAGVHLFLIDAHGEPVAPGSIGEICVQSRYLSPGYWKDPALTQTKFLPDPQGGDERIFRTGDLGRLRPDGALEHLGRKDSQVKIRGFRVETQEVEARLSLHPEVQACVVDVATDDEGERRLMAWVVPAAGRSVRPSALRRFVADALPHYMVPAAVLMLNALPQTPNGKVDRRALAAASSAGLPPSGTSIAVPADATQQQLLRIWTDVLGLREIAVTDNFFDLGGNSLIAARMMVRIQQSFGQQLLPTSIFVAPSIAQLATLLRQPFGDAPLPSLVPVQPHGGRPPFFWIHGDASSGFLPAWLGPDQPVYGLEHQSQDGRPAAFTSVETIAAHYRRQMMAVQPHGPYLLGGYSFGGTVAFEVAQQLAALGEHVALLVLLDSLFPGAADSAARTTEEARRTPPAGMTASRQPPSHLRRLASLSLRGKCHYVGVRIAARFDVLVGYRLRRFVKRQLCALCLRRSWVLPPSVRGVYIRDIYQRALRQYAPQPFPGRAVYFKTGTRASFHLARWSALFRDGLETYEVPGNHVEVVRKDNLAIWAERLASAISRAQLQTEAPRAAVSESSADRAAGSAALLHQPEPRPRRDIGNFATAKMW